jgi:hypothetical protein
VTLDIFYTAVWCIVIVLMAISILLLVGRDD